MVPDAAPCGRPRKGEKREIVAAILHLLRAGCAWRLLPHDFPPWQTVYHYLRRWEREGIWAGVLHTLVMADRERASRKASPSAAIVDSQTVRTADQKGDSKGTTQENASMGASGICLNRRRRSTARRRGSWRRRP